MKQLSAIVNISYVIRLTQNRITQMTPALRMLSVVNSSL